MPPINNLRYIVVLRKNLEVSMPIAMSLLISKVLFQKEDIPISNYSCPTKILPKSTFF